GLIQQAGLTPSDADWQERAGRAEEVLREPLLLVHHFRQALDHLDDAACLAPRSPEAQAQLLALYFRLCDRAGDADDKLRILQRARKYSPDDGGLQRRLQYLEMNR